MKEENVVYFELNNWFRGEHYPAEEPFDTWIGNDLDIKFSDEKWVKENKLCVVESIIDMSCNYCITASRKWVEENCPRLLTIHKEFLRYPSEDGKVYGNFDDEFLEYKEENFVVKQNID